MNEIKDFIDIVNNNTILKCILSNRENGDYKKIVFEKIKDKYYISKYTEKQVFNENISSVDLSQTLIKYFEDFKQINAFTETTEYQVKRSKKDKIFISKTPLKVSINARDNQNIEKNRILKDGAIIEPLIDMGIFSRDGKIISSMYDKYKQINKFIEIIDDKVKDLKKDTINIIDFGCGKSYLTFIVYYYFRFIKKMKINMVGLDLKKDVIDNCNKASKKYGYDTLKFVVCDIKDYVPEFDVDMVLTLHACDTATDYALFNAIKWNANMIFSVPCCQHEVNSQIDSNDLKIVTRYGIAKERISAIFTDIIRCNLLKYSGYGVDLIEFINLDHTPKNLLIRAVRTNISRDVKIKMLAECQNLMQTFNFSQKLYKLITGERNC